MGHEGEWKWINSGEPVPYFVWRTGNIYFDLIFVSRNISGEPNSGIEAGCMYTYRDFKAGDYQCDGATQNYPLCQIPL